VIPYADFTYFVLLLYVAVPTVILGLFGRAGWRWALLVTTVMLLVQYRDVLHLRAHFPVREIWLVLAFASWQWLIVRAFAAAGARAGWLFYTAIGLSVLPLALAKVIPLVSPKTQFGFLGISYVTFRALDIVFCLRDSVIARPGTVDLFMFLFFFPTISAGPIDRYRRFVPDWRKTRCRTEFLIDLDSAVHHFFRGLLYKFILAALIEQHWSQRAATAWVRCSVTCMPTASTCSSISPDIALSRSALVICLEFTLQKTLTGRSSLGTSAISGIAGISRFPSGFETTFTCVSYSLLRAANGSGACIPPRSWDTFWPSD
jgi:D-alanyl-lipoteichoic acid acyltransferase DltB (MBOAT superfamily)